VTSKPELLCLFDFLHDTAQRNDGARIFDETSGTVNKILVDNEKTREQNARPLAHEHDAHATTF